MASTLKRLLRETDAQNLSEYGLALAVVGMIAAAAAVAIRNNVSAMWARSLQRLIIAFLGA